jgi:hypothetical protein
VIAIDAVCSYSDASHDALQALFANASANRSQRSKQVNFWIAGKDLKAADGRPAPDLPGVTQPLTYPAQ